MFRPILSASAVLLTAATAAQPPRQVGVAENSAPTASNQLAGERPSALLGTWKVVGVGVSDQGVQALVPNDRAYMGKTVTIAIDHLWWNGADYHDLASPIRDMCIGPRLRPADVDAVSDFLKDEASELRQLKVGRGTGFYITCTSGDWGPKDPAGPFLLQVNRDTLVMPWYDGGLLKLVRTR